MHKELPNNHRKGIRKLCENIDRTESSQLPVPLAVKRLHGALSPTLGRWTWMRILGLETITLYWDWGPGSTGGGLGCSWQKKAAWQFTAALWCLIAP